jgi:hypothetical protein
VIYAVALITVACYFTYYRIAQREGSTARKHAALVALGFTAATPLLFIAAVTVITVKFAHLLIKELTT